MSCDVQGGRRASLPFLDSFPHAAHEIKRLNIALLELQVRYRVLVLQPIPSHLSRPLRLFSGKVLYALGKWCAQVETAAEEKSTCATLESDLALKVHTLVEKWADVDIVWSQDIFVRDVVEPGACNTYL